MALWPLFIKKNKKYKHKEFKKFCADNKVVLIVGTENRVKECNAPRIITKFVGLGAGLLIIVKHQGVENWILWNQHQVDFNTIRIHTQFIHGQVTTLQSSITFNHSIIYGLHTISNRMGLWCDLKDIINALNCPRVIMGEFNTI